MADPSSGGIDGAAIPTVSVLIPVLNAMAYLHETIDSIVQQTLQPTEVIFIDDGSTDGTREFVEAIELPFPKHVLYQKGGFQSAARNLAAARALGTYLAFIDHDDVWYPPHLEQLVALLEADPLRGWAYSDMNEMDKDGGLIATNIIRHLNPAAEHPKTNIINMMSSDMFIFPSAAMVRKDAFLKIGGFDERLSGYEDDDLFLRMFRDGWRNAFNPEATICYRRHFGSSAFSERMWLSREIFADKLCEAYPDEPELVRFYVRDIIAPRFYSHAKEEYWRHFPHKRWNLCLRSLDLMQHFSDLSDLSIRNRIRRFIGFRILARPRLFEQLYPILRLLTPLPRFVMSQRPSVSPEDLDKSGMSKIN